MGRHLQIGRGVGAALACLATLGIASEAHAVQYGDLHITANTTLTADRYGDIVFDADNITLNCNNHQVHISSYTKPQDSFKAAIYAKGRSGITIKGGCKIVGGFDFSVVIRNSTNVTVQGVSAGTEAYFDGNTNTNASDLKLSGGIALDIPNDTQGRYSANITCQTEGIHVDFTKFTLISNTTISGCDYMAIAGDSNTSLTLDHVNSQGSGTGVGLMSDTNGTIQNSVFSNNRYGIEILTSNNVRILGNTALGNAVCDADEESSSSDTWSGNTFGTTCGTVPAIH